MFKVDDLVVKTGTSEVMRVLEYVEGLAMDPSNPSTLEPDTVHVAIGNDDSDDWFCADELTLVTDNQPIVETKPMGENVPTLTYEQINEEICKMFVQVANYMNATLDGARISLSIEANDFSSDSPNIDVAFKAKVRYDDHVVSNDLNKSAKIAVQRHQEDEGLKPLSIPTYK
jgi:hypothetical protein